MLVSFVIPLLNERGSLRLLTQELLAVAHAARLDCELIFVDDGSHDGSWDEIVAIAASERRVRGLRFAANRGKSAALAAGFAAAAGERIVTLDADLQDDPHEAPALLESLDAGLDLVVGWKRRRQDARSRIALSWFFNYVVSALAGLHLHDHNCGFKAMRREVLAALWLDHGMHRFIPPMAQAAGLRVGERPVNHRARRVGRSRDGWARIPCSAYDLLRLLWRTRWLTAPVSQVRPTFSPPRNPVPAPNQPPASTQAIGGGPPSNNTSLPRPAARPAFAGPAVPVAQRVGFDSPDGATA